MIRCRNGVVALLRCQALRFQPVTVANKAFYCSKKQEEKPPEQEEEKFDQHQKRREQKDEFFQRRALILKGGFETMVSNDGVAFTSNHAVSCGDERDDSTYY